MRRAPSSRRSRSSASSGAASPREPRERPGPRSWPPRSRSCCGRSFAAESSASSEATSGPPPTRRCSPTASHSARETRPSAAPRPNGSSRRSSRSGRASPSRPRGRGAEPPQEDFEIADAELIRVSRRSDALPGHRVYEHDFEAEAEEEPRPRRPPCSPSSRRTSRPPKPMSRPGRSDRADRGRLARRGRRRRDHGLPGSLPAPPRARAAADGPRGGQGARPVPVPAHRDELDGRRQAAFAPQPASRPRPPNRCGPRAQQPGQVVHLVGQLGNEDRIGARRCDRSGPRCSRRRAPPAPEPPRRRPAPDRRDRHPRPLRERRRRDPRCRAPGPDGRARG